MIALGLIVVVVVVILALVINRILSSSGGCTNYYCVAGRSIPPPNGYSFASQIFRYNQSKGQPPPGQDADVQLPLAHATNSATSLSFFQYNTSTNSWETIAPATLDQHGTVARGTLSALPAYIAVLRRSTSEGQVVAYLPHDGTLNPDARGKITILHTLDFTPAADGTVSGQPSRTRPPGTYTWIPVISANSGLPGSVQAIRTILASAASRSQHVQAIVNLTEQDHLSGIDIAYMDLIPSDRTSFTLFVQDLAQALHNVQKQLTITLPPPAVTGDRLYEGAYDWSALGQAADLLEIAPYRDQSTYRQDMPIILHYLTSVVHPSSKLILIVSPYAEEKNPEGSVTTMTIAQAMSIATQFQVNGGGPSPIETGQRVNIVGVNIDRSSGRSGVVWDPQSACVAFTFENHGGHTMWLENFYSVGFKLENITRYQLGGVGVENASNNPDIANVWTAIVPFLASGEPILRQPNAQDLQPRWETSDGATDDTRKGSIVWSAPATAGTYVVKLTLSDGISDFQSETSVAVVARGAASSTATSQATP